MHDNNCLFCVNPSISVPRFEISEDNERTKMRYDLTYYLGHEIESYLTDEDLLCRQCMNFFKNMAYMKRRLVYFLRDKDECVDDNLEKLKVIWKKFRKIAISLVKRNPMDIDDICDIEVISRSQTPNPMAYAYSEPYNQAHDEEVMEQERIRSMSTAPSEGTTSADQEVVKIFRRRRGPKLTRRKGEQKSRALSRKYDRNCHSAGSRLGYSRRSSTSGRSESSESRPSSKRKKRIVEGAPLKTRSVSRHEAQLANVTANIQSNTFYCTDMNCSLYFSNLDNLVKHKTIDHCLTARFDCRQCSNVYTTKQELDTHSKTHDVDILHCFECRAEFTGTENLQVHLRRHQEYSIECPYCYLSFLSRTEYSEHFTREHRGKTKKKIRETLCTILKSVVNEDKMNRTGNNLGVKHFQSIILVREPTPPTENSNDLEYMPQDLTDVIEMTPQMSPIVSDVPAHDNVPAIAASVVDCRQSDEEQTSVSVVTSPRSTPLVTVDPTEETVQEDVSDPNDLMNSTYSTNSDVNSPQNVIEVNCQWSNVENEHHHTKNLQITYYKPVVVLERLKI